MKPKPPKSWDLPPKVRRLVVPGDTQYRRQPYQGGRRPPSRGTAGPAQSLLANKEIIIGGKKISLDSGAIIGALGLKLFEFAQYAALSSIG